MKEYLLNCIDRTFDDEDYYNVMKIYEEEIKDMFHVAIENEIKIDKAIEYVEKYGWQEDIVGNTYSGEPMIDRYMRLDWDNCNELLEILNKEVK